MARMHGMHAGEEQKRSVCVHVHLVTEACVLQVSWCYHPLHQVNTGLCLPGTSQCSSVPSVGMCLPRPGLWSVAVVVVFCPFVLISELNHDCLF